jgi:hypothetical protein
MPSYKITRNDENGVVNIDSPQAILPLRPERTIEPAEAPPDIYSKRTVLSRRVVRHEDGTVEIEGGPAPAAKAGFDDFIADPLGDLPDFDDVPDPAEEAAVEAELDELLSDLDDADLEMDEHNAQVAAELAAEPEPEPAKAPEPEPVPDPALPSGYPCAHKGCDFVAGTKRGLTNHARRHAGG